MFNDSDRDRLDALAKRIDKAQKSADPNAGRETPESSGQYSGAVEAIRIGSDFVALVVLSGALGWYLDRKFDTMPWLMLGLLFVGFGLGFWVVMRFLAAKPEDEKR